MKSFRQDGKASILLDGQFGSTGKGLIAGWLGQHHKFDWLTTNASANAGHTLVLGDRIYISYHIPSAAFTDGDAKIFLNAGAIIDPDLLLREIVENDLDRNRVFIHPHATVIQSEHKYEEQQASSSATKIASTQKGVGAALASKIMRRGNVAKNDPRLKEFVSNVSLIDVLNKDGSVFIEVPQGFSLSLNSGMQYPYVTSREVTVAQAMADAGLHPHHLGSVLMSVRTYPIRVGNIVNEKGEEVGHSGPHYPDQRELKWEELGRDPEYTTVTKRMRRIFTWSDRQYFEAVRANRPDFVFLNFVNYMRDARSTADLIQRMTALGAPPTHYGVGPTTDDVIESWIIAFERMGWSGEV